MQCSNNVSLTAWTTPTNPNPWPVSLMRLVIINARCTKTSQSLSHLFCYIQIVDQQWMQFYNFQCRHNGRSLSFKTHEFFKCKYPQCPSLYQGDGLDTLIPNTQQNQKWITKYYTQNNIVLLYQSNLFWLQAFHYILEHGCKNTAGNLWLRWQSQPLIAGSQYP